MGYVSMGATQSEQRADLILRNALVRTMERDRPLATAIAISDGRILAVGEDHEVAAFDGPGARSVDLGGRAVIPGLVDNHVHTSAGGSILVGQRVDLSGAASIEEIVARIAERAAITEPGTWIETTAMPRVALAEDRMPDRRDLDQASDKHPIYVTQSGKNAVVNSYALRLAGIDRETPDPDGTSTAEGHIVRDPTGEPTGHLVAGGGDLGRSRWWELLDLPPRLFEFGHLPGDLRLRALEQQMAQFNAAGITSVRDLGATPAEFESFLELGRAGRATVRTDVHIGVPGSYTPLSEIEPLLDRYEELRNLSVEGWVRLAGLKVLIQTDGWWSVDPDKARALVLGANRRGWRLAFHAGSSETEEVNAFLVELLEEADDEREIRSRRFTWEHGLGLSDSTQLRKLAKLGVVISCQPTLTYAAASRSAAMGPQMDRLRMVKESKTTLTGIARARRDWGLPIKSWSGAGLTVTLGTDWPASRTTPESPLAGVAFAATQVSSVGELLPDEVVPVEEALRMATVYPAYSMFLENSIGTLKSGKLADLVILENDPLAVAPQELTEIGVVATFSGGRTVYLDAGSGLEA